MPGQCFEGHEKSDVLWRGKKIAGAAQRRNRDGLLIQGSVQASQLKISRADWEHAMCEVLKEGETIALTDLTLEGELEARVEQLVAEKYSRDEYNRRR